MLVAKGYGRAGKALWKDRDPYNTLHRIYMIVQDYMPSLDNVYFEW
jgi:hypothetical protein